MAGLSILSALSASESDSLACDLLQPVKQDPKRVDFRHRLFLLGNSVFGSILALAQICFTLGNLPFGVMNLAKAALILGW